MGKYAIYQAVTIWTKVSLKYFIAVKLSLGLCFHDCKHEAITSMLVYSCDCQKKKLNVITQIEIQDLDLC